MKSTISLIKSNSYRLRSYIFGFNYKCVEVLMIYDLLILSFYYVLSSFFENFIVIGNEVKVMNFSPPTRHIKGRKSVKTKTCDYRIT